jgi:acetolactate synthase I/II/III large subunit
VTTRLLLDEEVRAVEAVVRVLEAAGVDMVFGVPGGDTIDTIFDALFDHQDTIRTVLVREESLAGVMAEVYGRLTGRPGVVIGQGAFLIANALLGAIEGHLGSSPMLLIGDLTDVPPYSIHGPYQSGSGHYGSFDARAALSGVTKLTMAASDPVQVVQQTQLAIKHAMSGQKGPVAILYSGAAIRGKVGPGSRPSLYPTERYLPGPPSTASAVEVAAAARALLDSRRPAIIAGNGVRIGRAYQQLRELAEMLGAPVATTTAGKGVFAETHRLALGVMGSFGTPLANEVLGSSDVVLVVGSKLGVSDTANEDFRLLDPRRQTLVQVDIEPRNAAWTYPVDRVLACDAAVGLGQLADAIESIGRPSPDAVAERTGHVEAERARLGWFEVPESTWDEVPMLPQRLIHEIQAAIPDNAYVVCDAGGSRVFMSRFFQAPAEDSFLQPGSGGMGYAVPAALAVQLLHPGRPVVAVCGDGGFGMSMNGMMSAREHGLPIVTVVFDNRVLGVIRTIQGDRAFASSFPEYDYAAIARAMGCGGIRVERPDGVRPALTAAFASGRPTVVDAVTSSREGFTKLTWPRVTEL